MTTKELLLQELESVPDDQLGEVLNFLQLLKSQNDRPATYGELLERIDYLEAIVGIRKGLEEFDQGRSIPAEQALDELRERLNIPPRP